MRSYEFTLNGARLSALPSGALWWAETGVLCVSDLHFRRPSRHLRRDNGQPDGGNAATLARLERDILKRNPQTIVCLGDSFGDLETLDEMDETAHRWLNCLMAGRIWIWISGSNRAGPVELGGTHLARYRLEPLTFRHAPDPDARGEIAGSHHPRCWFQSHGERRRGACFLVDERRVILPAYGVFSADARNDGPILAELMDRHAMAVLTGRRARPVPMRL